MNKIKTTYVIKEKLNKEFTGFTIVELIVVIAIIGTLAAVVMASYAGLTKKAVESTIKTDLKGALDQLKLDHYENGGVYPATIALANDGKGLAKSPNTTYQYSVANGEYCLEASAPNANTFHVSSKTGSIEAGDCDVLTFAKALGTAVQDYGVDVVQANDGGYVVLGYTLGYGADAVMSKYSSDGTLSWSKAVVSAGYTFPSQIIKTISGGYAIVGRTQDFSAGDVDSFLMVFNSTGDVQWTRLWGGTLSDYSNGVYQTSDGGFIITGQTSSYGTACDLFVAKYDSTGTLQWDKIWGGAGTDRGFDVVQTSDGGYAVLGDTTGFGVGGNEVVIVKLNSTGGLVWNYTWGGTAADYGSQIIQTSDNGLVIVGSTFSFANLQSKLYIAKFRSNGGLLWNKVWGGGASDSGSFIGAMSDGSFVVGGRTSSYGAGGTDSLFVKYNSVGDLTWSKVWGAATEDYAYAAASASDGGYIAVGNSVGFGVGQDDLFVLKYNSNGNIDGCFASMCQDVSPTYDISPSSSARTPAATLADVTATTASPTFTTASVSMTSTNIVSQ